MCTAPEQKASAPEVSGEQITSSYVCSFSSASYACELPFCASFFSFRLA